MEKRDGSSVKITNAKWEKPRRGRHIHNSLFVHPYILHSTLMKKSYIFQNINVDNFKRFDIDVI